MVGGAVVPGTVVDVVAMVVVAWGPVATSPSARSSTTPPRPRIAVRVMLQIEIDDDEVGVELVGPLRVGARDGLVSRCDHVARPGCPPRAGRPRPAGRRTRTGRRRRPCGAPAPARCSSESHTHDAGKRRLAGVDDVRCRCYRPIPARTWNPRREPAPSWRRPWSCWWRLPWCSARRGGRARGGREGGGRDGGRRDGGRARGRGDRRGARHDSWVAAMGSVEHAEAVGRVEVDHAGHRQSVVALERVDGVEVPQLEDAVLAVANVDTGARSAPVLPTRRWGRRCRGPDWSTSRSDTTDRTDRAPWRSRRRRRRTRRGRGGAGTC